MLLGDSCLSLKYNAHRKGQNPVDLSGVGVVFHTAHCIRQKDYCLWKVREIEKIFEAKKLAKKFSINTYTRKSDSRTYIQTTLHWTKYFRILYPKIYKFDLSNKRKKTAKWLLDQIYNDKHLAIWFMDDGCEIKQKKKHKDGTIYYGRPMYYLAINGFTFGEAQVIKEWFEHCYKVSPKIRRVTESTGNMHPVLLFKTKDSETLWQHMGVYIKQIPSMRNKFDRSLFMY